MNNISRTQVLIIGAGPTGLTLACDLARRGVACRIVERAPEYFTSSRGKGLQPRSLEVLDDLGVVQSLLASGAPYPPLRGYDGERVVWERSMHEHRDPTPDVPYPNILMLPQWRTEAILRQRLATYDVQVELATELISFVQDADSVQATLVHNGETEHVQVDYLVGADGGHSFVRKQLGVGFEGDTYESERILIGDVQADGLDREHWHIWLDAAKRTLKIGLCPLSGTKSFQLTAPIDSDAVPELSLESLQQILDQASGGSEIRLHDLTWLSVYRVNIRMVDRYRVGRVLLAGDAAHVHSPAGGQGMNTGIQDAYNLGWKLGQVLAGAPETLLDTYEEERKPMAAEVLGISTRLYNKAKQGETDAHRRSSETQQLGLSYRGSTLARDERATPGHLQAGDRAPDAPCYDATGTARSLFNLFRGPHFTLLAFGVGYAELVAEINSRYGERVHAYTLVQPGEAMGIDSISDIAGHAHHAYDIDADTVVLVRPDGYIGMMTQDRSAEQLNDYLNHVVARPIGRV